MKRKKLLRKIKELLSAKRRAQLAQYDSLVKVLHKLDKKEAALRESLKEEKDKKRSRELQHKIDVIEAQRKKGDKLRRKLEKLRDDD
jgi:hypothetical protein